MRSPKVVRSLMILAVLSVAGSAFAARERAKPMLRVEPPQHVKDRLAARGTPWQALSPSQTRGYTDAVRREARAQGANPPRQIVSLGGTGKTQNFYVVYPNSTRDRLAPYAIVTVTKQGQKYDVAETHESTNVARSPHAAWMRAATAITGGYALMHRAIPLGMSTSGSMLFRAVGSNTIAEVGAFRGTGKVKLHRDSSGAWDIRPGSTLRLVRAAGLDLQLPGGNYGQ